MVSPMVKQRRPSWYSTVDLLRAVNARASLDAPNTYSETLFDVLCRRVRSVVAAAWLSAAQLGPAWLADRGTGAIGLGGDDWPLTDLTTERSERRSSTFSRSTSDDAISFWMVFDGGWSVSAGWSVASPPSPDASTFIVAFLLVRRSTHASEINCNVCVNLGRGGPTVTKRLMHY